MPCNREGRGNLLCTRARRRRLGTLSGRGLREEAGQVALPPSITQFACGASALRENAAARKAYAAFDSDLHMALLAPDARGFPMEGRPIEQDVALPTVVAANDLFSIVCRSAAKAFFA